MNARPAMNGRPAMNVRRVAGSIGATVLTVLWVAPIILLVLAALGLPGAGTNGDVAPSIGFDAFREVLAGGPIIAGGIGPYVANSIAVSIPAVFIPLVAGVLAAYALAWIRFPGSSAVLVTLAALALIPVQLALLPLAGFFQDGWQFGSIWLIPPTGLGSSYLPMWCAHAVLLLPLTILVLLAAMTRIPRDVMDQARLDGAGHALILWRIVLPMLWPAVASLFLVLFILTWNDLLIALVFAGGLTQVTPVTAYLALFMTSDAARPSLVSAAAVVAMAIPLALYALAPSVLHRGIRAAAFVDPS